MLYQSRSPIHDLGVDPGHRVIRQAGHGGQEKGRRQVWASEPERPAASVQGLKEMSGPIGTRCRAYRGAKAQGAHCAKVKGEPWRVSPRRRSAEAEPGSPPQGGPPPGQHPARQPWPPARGSLLTLSTVGVQNQFPLLGYYLCSDQNSLSRWVS